MESIKKRHAALKGGTRGRLAYRGVVERPRKGAVVYEARIFLKGKYQSLGHFETAEQAARVYDRWSKREHGFVVNFPE